MSDHSDIHNIIDRIFTNESELIKEKARNCLDFTTKAITNSFDEQNSIKFIEALSAYFGAKMSFEEATKAKDLNEYSSENSNESSSDSEVDEPKAPVPVVRRKRANASNGFNNFLSIEGKCKYSVALLSI
jgi:hypothetical protein